MRGQQAGPYTVSVMFGRTNPLNQRLTRGQKRTMAIVFAAILLVFVGLGLWGALASDPYSKSANGCVNVTLPSSTGGGVLHYCGADARNFCRFVQRRGAVPARGAGAAAVPPGWPPSGKFGFTGSLGLRCRSFQNQSSWAVTVSPKLHFDADVR